MQTPLRFICSASLVMLMVPLACTATGPLDTGPGDLTGPSTGGGSGDINISTGGTMGGGNDLDVQMMLPPSMSCGDGILDDDEACDDKNMNSGDGCGSNCRYIEPGYVCPDEGELCRAFAKCGDGAVIFPEQCDDGGLMGGDGCSEFCKFEIGFKCDGSPSVCTPSVCGDGKLEGAETCDDNNNIPFDGCSDLCQGEPDCTSGNGCTSGCGDGLKIGDEECDDGNAIKGDGCSETCKKEPGYVCGEDSRCPEDEPDCPLELPIVFRDFNVGQPSDFRAPESGDPSTWECDGYAPGIAKTALNMAGKPEFSSSPAKSCVTPAGFPLWYTESDQSSTILGSVTLYPNDDGGFVNRFGPNGEQYMASVATGNEQGNYNSLAACQGTDGCVNRAREAQPPFKQTDGPLHCTENEYCSTENNAARTIRDGALNQANNALMQAMNRNPPATDEELADLQAAVDDAEALLAAAEAATATCIQDCQDELDARTAICAAQCAPCSGNPAQYCIGGEQVALDGNPLFFPVDNIPDGTTPDALTPVGAYYSARIPAQIYQAVGWPWEGGGTGDEPKNGPKHNFHFTSEIAYWFEYSADMAAELTFVGDDDVFVFVNRKLLIDLGGIHVPLIGQFTIAPGGAVTTHIEEPLDPGSEARTPMRPINDTTTAAALGLEPGKVYEIKVFHAERKPEGSSFQLTLSGFEASRSECHSICGDGILAAGEQCDEGENNAKPGEAVPQNGCSADCNLGPYCGDGIVQEPLEECDDNDPNKPKECAGCRLIIVK